MPADLQATMAAIAVHHSKIEQNNRMADNLLAQISGQLCGRRIERSGKHMGNLAGVYEISAVSLSFDAKINASGRKVLSNGRLGSKTWDLGHVWFDRLLPLDQASAA